MRNLLNLIFVGLILYSLFWFIQFQSNPYKNCEDHPEKEKKDKYYLCEPGSFELKKGLIENKGVFPTINQGLKDYD